MTEERKSPIDQFGAVAARYAESDVHARGLTLLRVIELTQPKPDHIVLDVATGAGHMALTMAPLVSMVFATDITPQMLHQARKLAAERGISNIKFEIAPAENLPYPDGTFDIVTCRTAAHHFSDVRAFVREAYRVLKPGGRLAVVDDTVPEDPEANQVLNEIEWKRDRSHIRNYTPEEWRGYLSGTGLKIEHSELTTDIPEGTSYRQWMHRANASEDLVEELKRALLDAPAAAREAYGVSESGDDLVLRLPMIVIMGRKIG